MAERPKRISKAIEAISGENVFDTGKFTLHHARILGENVTFCSNMRRDAVQRTNRKGKFYEQEELELLGKLIPADATIVDIGANAGNHTLFFAKILKAKRVIPFEPNPLAYEVLLANVCVNGVTDRVDLAKLGFGLSDQSAEGFAMEKRERNLGAASMIEGEGDIAVVRGDQALAGVVPDFIKVDVEGMELGVLRGLGDLPASSKCIMYIEVNNENADGFVAWRDENKLKTIHEIKRYRSSLYHLVVHQDRADEISQQLETHLNEAKDA